MVPDICKLPESSGIDWGTIQIDCIIITCARCGSVMMMLQGHPEWGGAGAVQSARDRAVWMA